MPNVNCACVNGLQLMPVPRECLPDKLCTPAFADPASWIRPVKSKVFLTIRQDVTTYVLAYLQCRLGREIREKNHPRRSGRFRLLPH